MILKRRALIRRLPEPWRRFGSKVRYWRRCRAAGRQFSDCLRPAKLRTPRGGGFDLAEDGVRASCVSYRVPVLNAALGHGYAGVSVGLSEGPEQRFETSGSCWGAGLSYKLSVCIAALGPRLEESSSRLVQLAVRRVPFTRPGSEVIWRAAAFAQLGLA